MRAAIMLSGTVLAVGVAWAGGPSASEKADGPRWLDTFDAARAEARRLNRPILAVLH